MTVRSISWARDQAHAGNLVTRESWRGTFLFAKDGVEYIMDKGDRSPQRFEPDEVEESATDWRLWTREDTR